MTFIIQCNFSQDTNSELEKKLKNLDRAYYMGYNDKARMNILLTMDEIKIEMIKRGIYERNH